MIVHGFSAPETGHGAVTFVSDIARRLLAESKQAAPARSSGLLDIFAASALDYIDDPFRHLRLPLVNGGQVA